MSAAADLLPPRLIRAINRPVQEANGLPREAYTDPAFLALERAHVFDASWVFVTAAASIPGPGASATAAFWRSTTSAAIAA